MGRRENGDGVQRALILNDVNNAYRKGKQPLVSSRPFCVSPFGDGDIYVGGDDSSRKISDDMAWIFKAPLEVALGRRAGQDAPPQRPWPTPDQRLLPRPVYELRIRGTTRGADHSIRPSQICQVNENESPS